MIRERYQSRTVPKLVVTASAFLLAAGSIFAAHAQEPETAWGPEATVLLGDAASVDTYSAAGADLTIELRDFALSDTTAEGPQHAVRALSLFVPYQAPEGRRVSGVSANFTLTFQTSETASAMAILSVGDAVREVVIPGDATPGVVRMISTAIRTAIDMSVPRDGIVLNLLLVGEGFTSDADFHVELSEIELTLQHVAIPEGF